MIRDWMTKDPELSSARVAVCADGRVSKRAARWLIKLGQGAEEGVASVHPVFYRRHSHELARVEEQFLLDALDGLGIKILRRGNDAPRGGACGNWYEIDVRSPEFRRAYAAAKHDWDGRLWNSYTWGTKFPDLPKA